MPKSKLFAIILGVVAVVIIAFTVVQAQSSVVAEDVLAQVQATDTKPAQPTNTKPAQPTITKPAQPTITRPGPHITKTQPCQPPCKTKHPPPPPPPRPTPGGPGNLEFIVFYATLGVLLISVIGFGLFLRKKSQKEA